MIDTGLVHSDSLMQRGDPEREIWAYYRALFGAWGNQHWWPARTRFEVVAGAYLTQNTSWKNVELALNNLRKNRALSLAAVRAISLRDLEQLIRPAGYFRQKAARLKTFVAFVDACYGGSLQRMFRQPTETLRRELLALHGVGPETADSILLYAGQHPIFVVDAYTRRIVDRHGILPANSPYDEIRVLFERALSSLAEDDITANKTPGPNLKHAAHPHEASPMSRMRRSPLAQRFNDMHGLIVGVGKLYCRKAEPSCENCPLRRFLS